MLLKLLSDLPGANELKPSLCWCPSLTSFPDPFRCVPAILVPNAMWNESMLPDLRLKLRFKSVRKNNVKWNMGSIKYGKNESKLEFDQLFLHLGTNTWLGRARNSMLVIMTWDTLFFHFMVNSLWPSDTIWRHKSGSTLAQIMACCLTAASHYLIQCWLVIKVVLWHTPESNFTGGAQELIL